MKEEIIIKKVKLYFFILLAVVFIAFAIHGRRQVYKREHNSLIATGTITEKGHRAKTNYYVAYSFVVNGVEYFGSVPIRYCHECDKACCQIGAKVKVRFEKSNPDNNDLVH